MLGDRKSVELSRLNESSIPLALVTEVSKILPILDLLVLGVGFLDDGFFGGLATFVPGVALGCGLRRGFLGCCLVSPGEDLATAAA